MLVPPPPPPPTDMAAGTKLIAGAGTATILPDLDWETKSEAGFVWNKAKGKWDGPPNSPQNKKGLQVVGVAVYAEHESTDILSLYYDLKDGAGRRHWCPILHGANIPADLHAHIANGGLLEAWNSGFEWWIWNKVAVRRYGWPPLDFKLLRCAMAKSRASGYPGGLGDAGAVLQLPVQKDPAGDRLLKKFSVPQKPTKKQPGKWIELADDWADAQQLFAYNEKDIMAEAWASSRTADLSDDELAYWLADQEINQRGVAVDHKGVGDCIAVIEEAFLFYNAELVTITGGAVTQASELPSLKEWLSGRGIYADKLDEENLELHIASLKESRMDPTALRALEIRALIGSASIKKLYAMRNQSTAAHRLHDLFLYYAARTGRWAGMGPQPQNLPKAGPDLFKCVNCNHWFGAHTHTCPWCRTIQAPDAKKREWTADAHNDAFLVLASRSLRMCETFFGDAIQLIVGCLRGLFIAADGHDLIASDYSAIEAVVLAALAGEDWRLRVFADGRDIYLASAARITGLTMEFYEEYKRTTGQHHPHRQPFGKIAELSSGYGGWIGAWISFGADEYFIEQEIQKHILAWRDASPRIVEFWGGQWRGLPWLQRHGVPYYQEFFGLEGAAIKAVLNPGTPYTVVADHWASRPITYTYNKSADILYCHLPSGRPLLYHAPRLERGKSGPHDDCYLLSYETWNTNSKMGAFGWVRVFTYGGKLCENVVQAVARDILAAGIVRIQAAGWPVVLHVHDEIVAETPVGDLRPVSEFEAVMSEMPKWAWGWWMFLRAKGGWRGRRYRKD